MSGSGHSRPKLAFHVNPDQIKYVGISHYHANHKERRRCYLSIPITIFFRKEEKSGRVSKI